MHNFYDVEVINRFIRYDAKSITGLSGKMRVVTCCEMVWHVKLSREQCFKENYLNFQQVADKAYRPLLLYLLIARSATLA